jgi:hypothetical protein
MNQSPVKQEQQLPFTSEEWDSLRFELQNTVIAKTNLCSLAKNLGCTWPIRGKDETPERYMHFTLGELVEMPEIFGKGNRLELLYSILLDTKHLDDPFTDMIQHLDEVAQEKIEPQTPMQQLEVPPEFPVELINFTRKTQGLCREGGHDTLESLIKFLEHNQSAARINGEFREFYDNYRNVDRARLRKFLPIREGSKGIFLTEALGLIGERLNDQQAATLVYAFKVPTAKPAWSESVVLPKLGALSLIKQVRESAQKAFTLMPDQAQELRCSIEAGITTSIRYFVALDDADQECLAIAIAMAAMDMKPRMKGFMSGLLA